MCRSDQIRACAEGGEREGGALRVRHDVQPQFSVLRVAINAGTGFYTVAVAGQIPSEDKSSERERTHATHPWRRDDFICNVMVAML